MGQDISCDLYIKSSTPSFEIMVSFWSNTHYFIFDSGDEVDYAMQGLFYQLADLVSEPISVFFDVRRDFEEETTNYGVYDVSGYLHDLTPDWGRFKEMKNEPVVGLGFVSKENPKRGITFYHNDLGEDLTPKFIKIVEDCFDALFVE